MLLVPGIAPGTVAADILNYYTAISHNPNPSIAINLIDTTAHSQMFPALILDFHHHPVFILRIVRKVPRCLPSRDGILEQASFILLFRLVLSIVHIMTHHRVHRRLVDFYVLSHSNIFVVLQ